MSGRVIVVGSVNVDLVVRAPRLPGPGETVTGGAFSRHHGGKGGNQAVAAARLGTPTSIVGAVGDDDLAAVSREALAADGVDVAELRSLGVATGVALIVVDARGENLIAVALGANDALTPDHVAESLARLAPVPGDIVLVDHEVPTATVRDALRQARAAGATTILNPAPADALDRSILSLADILTPNRTELATLVAEDARRIGRPASRTDDSEAAARSLLETNAEGPGVARAVLVTLGASGALLVERGVAAVDIRVPPVTAVDAVGAGDAVNGALAAGLAAGVSLEEAARRSVIAASLSTQRVGAREGLPTTDELDAALSARD